MIEDTLLTLADFHYELGYIGHDEYRERVRIAVWLAGNDGLGDPRCGADTESRREPEETESEEEVVVSREHSVA